jgi:copper chaperone CopZ
MHNVSCLGCIRRIERNFRQQAGVQHAEIDSTKAPMVAVVSYDPHKVKLKQLVAIVKQETDDYIVRKNAPAAKP